MHKCDPQMGLVVFVTFSKAFFIYFLCTFFYVSLEKCISEYIYSRTIHILKWSHMNVSRSHFSIILNYWQFVKKYI